MASLGIGDQLKAAREALGLSLEAVQAVTKIRPAILRALEDERFADLPPRAFTRGYLRTYASMLGLDPAPLLAAYDAGAPGRWDASSLTSGSEVPIRPARPRSPLRRAVTTALVAAVVVLVAVAAVAYFQVRAFVASDGRAAPEAPGARQPSPSPPSEGPTETPPAAPAEPPGEAPAEAPPAPPPARGVTVDVAATAACWLRVVADGSRVFEGLLRAGERRTWTADRVIELRIGNAGGVGLTVNGRDLGAPGARGEVVNRRFAAREAAPRAP